MNNSKLDNIQIGSGRRKHLIFILNDKRYCTPLSEVKEVVSVLEITPLPQVPRYFRGLINLRGQIVSVIDLSNKLGFPEIEISARESCIIIFQIDDIALGALVEEVVSVSNFPQKKIETGDTLSGINKDPSSSIHKVIKGVIKEENNKLTLLIDLKKALNIDELRLLKDKVAA